MSDKYKMRDLEKAYFLTMTIVDWIDVFTRNNHKLLIVESLKYCQKNMGLEIFGWCLMSNHLHLIARSNSEKSLYEILRDFKRFTSREIIEQISEDHESRKDWMLHLFKSAGRPLKRIRNYKVWQDGNHAQVIYSPGYFYEKLNYIHRNPVKKMIVENPEDYLFSSARNYAGRSSLLDIILESSQLIVY